MGQCYFVKLRLKYKDESLVIRAANDYISNASKKRTVFYDGYGFDTVKGIVKSILAEFQGGFEDKGDGMYESSFEGRYSWESVLSEFFMAIKPHLSKGSRIDVWPDHGHWSEEVT